jgi:glycosyltransferase domain-containing protein
MNNSKKSLTVLLTLWNREIYTVDWIKENITEEFNYIIADGSKSNENQDIFKRLCNMQNVKYIRYPYDESVRDYIKKMQDALLRINTPYVMTCDNDDFLSFKGIKACINALDNESDYGFANGNLRAIKEITRNEATSKRYFCLRFEKFNTKNLNDKAGVDAIKNLFRPYKQVWYGVYRTDLYKKIWEKIAISNLDNVFLIEIFQGQLAFALSRMRNIDKTHYIRLENSIASSAKQFSKLTEPHYYGIYFDDKYRAQVLEMGKIIAELLEVKTIDILKEYISYFSNNGNKKNLRMYLFNRLYNRALTFPLPLSIIRKII